ncbi:phage baseplate assembly protein [Lysobacter sp. GCM10012299]|uniref:phage baseplate assembly protein n=1 Tax=Lysobacter sp. GCM10012299 TaxID=3317333 RepID=UPI003619320D
MFEIRVNGRTWRLWKSANVSRSLDDNCASFRFESSSQGPGSFPIKLGDAVQILQGGRNILSGFADEIEASGSLDGHTIAVSGRDKVGDLVDSSVPDAAKALSGNLSMLSVAKAVVSALKLGIKVIDRSGGRASKTQKDIKSADSGQSCSAFLQEYAAKAQVYLISDGDGNLVLWRPTGSRAETPLLHRKSGEQNNVMTASLRLTLADRFHRYVVRVQDNPSSDDDALPGLESEGEGTSRTASAIDSQVRVTRYLEIKGEGSMTASDLAGRANEEANLRRARSTEYRASVQGDSQASGAPWAIGDLIRVQDDFNGVQRDMLLRSISISVDISGGSRSEMTLAPEEAYTTVPQTRRRRRARAKDGDDELERLLTTGSS